MTLANRFEASLQEALMDELEQKAREEYAPMVEDRAHDVLREYGRRNGYSVGGVIESSETIVERTRDRVVVRVGWTHEASQYFEEGVSPHRIDGSPILSFVWSDPPEWVTEEFEPEGDGYRVFFQSVDHPGIPESRFARAALDHLRREVQK